MGSVPHRALNCQGKTLSDLVWVHGKTLSDLVWVHGKTLSDLV
jgi:hypothetical protein